MSLRPPILGIDLGTTYSLVSVLRDGIPVPLPNALGEVLTPSAVSVADDGRILVGAPARARSTTHPERTALAFKRDMGTDRVYDLGGHRLTPPELSSLVLGSLKRDAEAALGVSIEEAVVTVPAYFDEAQRQATRAAADIAGLRAERIINEPTAAALAYGLHERHRELTAVVLDLGGGTFDVTVLELIEGRRPEQIDEILLVGGATRMPCIVRLASQIFGKLPLRHLPPDEAVALGAAVQAALKQGDEALEDMVVTDVSPLTLGVESATSLGAQLIPGLFTPIIDRGTVIPVSRVKRFYTVANGQMQIDVRIYQGEHSLCKDNRFLGQYSVSGLPARPAGEEAVDIRFTYDLNGLLEVETTVVSTGYRRALVLEQSPGRMTPKEIEKAHEKMAALKIHPRELLPNATALARAEALHQELTGPEREMLSHALALFRAALEQQDPESIELYRGQLNALIESWRRS